MATKLTAHNGDLYIPYDPTNKDSDPYDKAKGSPLLIIYPAGDCDRISWPLGDPKWAGCLAHALYDAREMGLIPGDSKEVELPDGSLFRIDENLEKYKPESMEGIWF